MPHHLVRAPSQKAFSRCVERLHTAMHVDHDNAIGGRVRNGAQARLALAYLHEHLPIAQTGIDRNDQHPDHEHDDRNGQGQWRAASGGGQRIHIGGLGEPQCGHAGVMHACNRQAHHRTGGPVQAMPAPAHGALQAKAHPQCHRGQHHGHHQRSGKNPRVVTHDRRPLRSSHADVMHGANARADQHAAHHQVKAADFAPHEKTQRCP